MSRSGARLVLALVILALALSVAPVDAATLYVTNNGSGTSCQSNLRCTLSTALGQAVAGDIISMAAGTLSAPLIYQGDVNMIHPPSGKSGTDDAHRITVQCEVDGGCLLDGQFQRNPVVMTSNSWWLLKGFNVKNGVRQLAGGGTQPALITVQQGSNDNIFRRIVGWDGFISQSVGIIINWSSFRNLYEDMAWFGTYNIGFLHYGGTGSATCRRCWGRFEGSTVNTQQKEVFQPGYDTPNFTCENCIATSSGESMPSQYRITIADGTAATVSNGNCPPGGTGLTSSWMCPEALIRLRGGLTNQVYNTSILGSFAYLRASDLWPSPAQSLFKAPTGGVDIQGVTFSDALALIHPSNSQYNNLRGFLLQNSTSASGTLVADKTSSIRGSLGDTFTSVWTDPIGSSRKSASDTTLSAALASLGSQGADPWTGTTGAQLCKQYVGGALTSTPLWPWPMNDRIKAATAGAGAYSGGCLDCTWPGGSPPARTQTDVTADIQALLGTIPAACSSASSTFPLAPGFPVTTELDPFTGTGPLSSNWTTLSGNGWQRASDAAQPTNGFSIIRWNTQYASDQEAWCQFSALPGDADPFYLNFRLTDVNNRLRAWIKRDFASNTASVTLDSVSSGVVSPIAGPVSMGIDMAVGDKIGVSAVGSSLNLNYYRASEGVWRTIASGTTTILNTGFIGMGAGSGACTSFGGGNVSTAVPSLATSPSSMTFTATVNGANPPSQTLTITDTANTGTMSWTDGADVSWISLVPSSGTGNANVTVKVNISGLTPAIYNGNITVTAPASTVTQTNTPVQLTVLPTASPSVGRGGRVR